MVLYLVYMILAKFPSAQIVMLMFGFLMLLLMNIASSAYAKEHEEFYTLNKFITTIGLFVLSSFVLFLFQSPSMLIGLFIAYAISVFYQDLRVLVISDAMMLFAVLMIVINYPEFLGLETATLDSRFGIAFFFIAFMAILSLSSFIIVKQKSFFFNQISSSKEAEFRNLDLLVDLKKEVQEPQETKASYYDALDAFLSSFCAKVGSENIFQEKVSLLRQLDEGTSIETLMEMYPKYQKEDFERLQDLQIGGHAKLKKAAMKFAYMRDLQIQPREIFSETQFKSFNHPGDSLEIKIIAFVLFYAALKRGFAILPKLEEEDILSSITETDFYYTMDPRIVRVYAENSAVFDAIIQDAFGKKARS